MKRAEFVFIPALGAGHLGPALKFATQLLQRDHRFSLTILLLSLPGAPQALPPSNSHHIRFLTLPPVDPPPLELLSKSLEKSFYDMFDRCKIYVKNAIIDHVLPAINPAPLAGLVMDMFLSSIIDVGKDLGVPSYLFVPTGAGFLGFMHYLEARNRQGGAEFEESDADSIIPSFSHPVPTRVLPSFAFNKEGGYISMVAYANKFKEAKGIIINTFAELEPHAVSSLQGSGFPPIYTVGPMLDLDGEYHLPSGENQNRRVMEWLHDQPPTSVVFLCFGSFGSFSQSQITEIAVGLENSGKRFLWSLRRPMEILKLEMPSDFEDYEDVLPEGFLERTKGKGMVCGWAPQVAVLAHKAIGGFISHCGWNSILESVWHGVPMVAWPQYAEQQLNAFELVKELGLAVEMKMDYRRGGEDVVGAEQIERAVRCVMNSDAEVRKRMRDVSENSRKALPDGGSSYISLRNLLDDMSANIFS